MTESAVAEIPAPSAGASQHVDVLIVGAGLSGIGAAYHLQAEVPGRSYAILESRGAIGGTWDLFRYPGIRSDSDMHTLGYPFRPWPEPKAIADGPAIRSYVNDTAREFGIDRHIRFHHRVSRAEWSSEEQLWTVDVERTDTGESLRMTCRFLFTCTGYYRYDQGHLPELPGLERFRGQVVHPQHWSEEVDYRGKRVVVIGSGATAVTLVPAMAEEAAHVTMLQRSPSYVISIPNGDPLDGLFGRILPRRLAHSAVRWKNVMLAMLSFQLSRRAPRLMRKLLRRGVERSLPPGFDVERHFTPTYNPWDQRLCLVPDGDLFRVLSSGRASIVTDRIETFTETGIRLESNQELEADLVVTATGLNLLVLGGIDLVVDGEPVDVSGKLTYRGMMISDVPNLALSIGYTNASWTLKCDLICQYVARLLRHMDEHGYGEATPRPAPGVRAERPFLDLASGYVRRSVHQFPSQGNAPPWRVHQNYLRDIALIRRGDLEEGMEFRPSRHAAVKQNPPVAAAVAV